MKMVEVKVSELEGAALDYAVAKAEGDEHWTSDRNPDWFAWRMRNWKPSTDWSQGGPLIDEYRPDIQGVRSGGFVAYLNNYMDDLDPLVTGQGDTYLIAACRAIVAAKLGDTVKIPAELA